jgi:biopolymer transport protein ExbB/TolQ
VTFFHAIQIALLLAVVALIVERVRTLSYRVALDSAAFRRALARLIRADRLEQAEALVAAARPAWAAEVVWPMFDPERDDDERQIDLEDRLLQVEADAEKGLRALRIAASVGSALGFIGAAVEIWWVFNADHGLMSLQAGLVENIGLGHAVLSIALGIATSSLGLGSWTILRKVARTLIMDTRRVAGSVEDLMAKNDSAPGVEDDDAAV